MVTTRHVVSRCVIGPGKSIYHRIYGDYIAADRIQEYRQILALAVKSGYQLTSVRDFWTASHDPIRTRKALILRHDIDTDPHRAMAFLRAETELGAVGSYYFRLSTLDYGMIEAVERAGGEASYHFEEIATYAKRFHIRDPGIVRKALPEVREEFISNYQAIKRRTDTAMMTVSSHGDFVNRRLGVMNWELLDPQTRSECGIVAETYDEDLFYRDVRVSDASPSREWTVSPWEAISADAMVIHFLTHPRHWGRRPWTNTRDNLNRLVQGIRYRIPRRPEIKIAETTKKPGIGSST